jgi:hypothetical protein
MRRKIIRHLCRVVSYVNAGNAPDMRGEDMPPGAELGDCLRDGLAINAIGRASAAAALAVSAAYVEGATVFDPRR